MSSDRDCKVDYELDEDEAQPMPSPSDGTRHIIDVLTQQLQGLSLDSFHLTRGPRPKAVAITNKASDSPGASDLQYVVYTPFPGNIQDPADLLETTARLLTASIIAHIPPNKTVYFEFHVPGSSVSYVLPEHPQPLQDLPFALGAPQTLETSQRKRALPLCPEDWIYRMLDPCRLFAVVLDRPSFITEPGVLFMKVTSNYPPDGDDDELWMDVRRSAGMPEVARRLAMLAVEKHQAGAADTRRILSREEYSTVWSTLPESYKERQERLGFGSLV